MDEPQRDEAASLEQIFVYAATTARTAPSIFNTQPWLWRVNLPVLRLYADRSRQLPAADPGGRLMVLSCGVALHHARIALAMCGHHPEVDRLADPEDPDLLAQIRTTTGHKVTVQEINAFAGMGRRHTDRRPFTDQPVQADVWRRLVAAAEHEGAHLHVIRDDQRPTFAAAVGRAGTLELSDPEYRRELATWTHRPPEAGDGVDVRSAVPEVPRPVPVRDFAPFDNPADPDPQGWGSDRGAGFGLVFTDDDTAEAWLRAGEALSAVLLEAASEGLATEPISDVTEVALTRERLRGGLLSGIGHPQIAVRIGYPAGGSIVKSARRELTETIHIERPDDHES